MSVGALIAHTGNCEFLFYGILECLLGKEGTTVAPVVWFSQKNTRARVELVAMLLHAQPISDQSREKIIDFIKTFKAIQKTRNFYAHAQYSTIAPYGEMVRGYSLVNDPNHIRETIKPLDKSTLNELVDAITLAVKLNEEMHLLLVELRREFAAHWLTIVQPHL